VRRLDRETLPENADLCGQHISFGSARMFVAPIDHHQHVNAFRAAWLNRLYDLVLALQSGFGPFGRLLHHDLGRHRKFLNPPRHGNPGKFRSIHAYDVTERRGSQ